MKAGKRVVTRIGGDGECVIREEDHEFEKLRADVEDLKKRVGLIEDLIHPLIQLIKLEIANDIAKEGS